MWKELAGVADSLNKWPIHYLLIALGFFGFLKIADRKSNDMPRDTRKKFQRYSALLIAFGLAILTFNLLVAFFTGGPECP